MCSEGWLVADFTAGTCEEPAVPELAGSLTMTVDGAWVVWAYKVADQDGDRFVPLGGRGSYPADAEAECLARPTGEGHTAPEPSCTCGFHALSATSAAAALYGRNGFDRGRPHRVCLSVVLSGRVLVFDWSGGGLLFRAARQTVVRVDRQPATLEQKVALVWRPDDPSTIVGAPPRQLGPHDPPEPGGTAARLAGGHPFWTGPARVALPSMCARVAVRDHAGWCGHEADQGRVARVPETVVA